MNKDRQRRRCPRPSLFFNRRSAIWLRRWLKHQFGTASCRARRVHQVLDKKSETETVAAYAFSRERGGRLLSRESVGGNDELGVSISTHAVNSAGGASAN